MRNFQNSIPTNDNNIKISVVNFYGHIRFSGILVIHEVESLQAGKPSGRFYGSHVEILQQVQEIYLLNIFLHFMWNS